MSNEMPLSRNDVIDQGYSAGWARKISHEMTEEILRSGDADTAAPEIRRFFSEKGSRELREMILQDAAGKSGPDAVRSMADAMRRFSMTKPAFTPVALQNLGEDNAPYLQAADALNKAALDILAEHRVTGEGARHALRMLKSLVRGFAIHKRSATYLDSPEYDRSFELAIDVFIEGMPALISGHELSNSPTRAR
jgi:hypothetical protein